MARYCRTYGEALAPDASFCPSCGRAVADVPGSAAPLAFAGYGRRVGAWFVDFLMIWVLALFLSTVSVVLPAPPATPNGEAVAYVVVTVVGVLIVCLLPCYSALLHRYWHGQTVGKRVVGIAVRTVDGAEIGLGQSLGRSYLRAAFWFFVPVWVADSLWPLGRSDGRSLHDLAAGTVVVQQLRAEM